MSEQYNWDKLFGRLKLESISPHNYASFVAKKHGSTVLSFFITDLEAYIKDTSKKHCFAISYYSPDIYLHSLSEIHKVSLCKYLLDLTGASRDSDQRLRELGVIK